MDLFEFLGTEVEFDGSPWQYLEKKQNNIDEQYISPDATVHESANIRGDVVIENGANIGPFTTIRDGTYIGEDVTIGHGTEVARSVLLEGSGAYHHNYVGDSVIGKNVSLSAGVMVAVHRLDDEDVGSLERKRAGVVIGRDSVVGINSSLNCGTVIETNSVVPPNTFVKRRWPE